MFDYNVVKGVKIPIAKPFVWYCHATEGAAKSKVLACKAD